MVKGGRDMNSNDKEYIRKMAWVIRYTDDEGAREKLHDVLIEKIYELIGNWELNNYENGCIYNTYINYDSNCGCSVIDATKEFDDMIEYLVRENIPITIDEVVNVLTEFGERDEYWEDLFDDDFYVVDADRIIEVIEEFENFKVDEEDINRRLKEDVEAFQKGE